MLFLDDEDVRELHRVVTAATGGAETIIMPDALASAVAAPQATFGGRHLNAFPFEMAAALLTALVRNHPFADGNKRIAVVAALTFLELNGIVIGCSDEVVERLGMESATGALDKAAAARLLHDCAGARG